MAKITLAKTLSLAAYFDGRLQPIKDSAFEYVGETTRLNFKLSAGYKVAGGAVTAGEIALVRFYTPTHKLVGTVEGLSLDAAEVWRLASAKDGEALFGYMLAGNDRFTGSAGNDRFNGYAGDDSLAGAVGNDRLDAGEGNDTLVGGDGNDSLTGGAGADSLVGSAGQDVLTGGAGDDVFVVDGQDTVLEKQDDGNDRVYSAVSLSIPAYVEELVLQGSDAVNATGSGRSDLLIGNTAANQLAGLAGKDTLKGGGGADTLIGGAGNDTYVIVSGLEVVRESSKAGTDTVEANRTTTLGANLENLRLTGTGNFNGTGNGLDNLLTGNKSNNLLSGLGGADSLVGGAGDDSLLGGAAGDSLSGGDGNDFLDGGAGDDTLNGGAGTNTLAGGSGDDVYDVLSATDVVTESASDGVDTVRTKLTYTLPANVENLEITGSSGAAVVGNALANVLSSSAGNDSIDGGGGSDTVSYATCTAKVVVNLYLASAQDTRDGGTDRLTSIENVIGGSADDFLLGNDSDNTLDGGAGADTLNGGYGNDTFIVDNAADVATEWQSAGTDTVVASVSWKLDPAIENLTLTGSESLFGLGTLAGVQNTAGSGNNYLKGNAGNNLLMGYNPLQPVPPAIQVGNAVRDTGNDTLEGGSGDDVLMGGGGSDSLQGGAGSDTFVFNEAPAVGRVATVTDFDIADDKIALRTDLFVGRSADGTYAPLTELEIDWFGQYASENQQNTGGAIGGTPDPNDYILYDFSTGALSYDADGSGPTAAIKFAQLPVGLYLSDTNFILYALDDVFIGPFSLGA